MKLISIFILGVGILIGAIFLNVLASQIGWKSWFEFFKNTKETSMLSYIWLFVGYPLGLGVIAYFISKYLNL